MSICDLVYPRPVCTLCTWRLWSFKDVHLYVGVPSSLLYLVYLETFVLCRCPSVHWCTLVPYVPCVPGDFCPLQMSICTLVYPRPLCTLCTWRLLSFKMSICTLVYPRPFCTLCTWRLLPFADVHLYLGVPSSLLYLVYLETFLLCRCLYVPWCTLVRYRRYRRDEGTSRYR